MKANKGLEAVAILRAGPDKGSLVAFAENLPDAAGDHTGWLWVKGKPVEIHLTNPGDYDVTDAAGLPDGGLLVLERRYPLDRGRQVAPTAHPPRRAQAGYAHRGRDAL